MSVIIFGFDLVVYILFFNGIDLIPDEVVFLLMVAGSIIGLILSWLGFKGVTRNVGIFGNIFVLLFTVIGPLIVRTFIWNTP
jgi:Na+/serine symporter